ncbi:alpha/beta hydrolase [Bifidobacterium simiarum]|uniref:alpha/beta hydrolase n=1 Tax=Bifidobacterium simiarum TaxID=2045441 RepID=UPI001F0AAD64|nr:alpha/beta hydrolase [Bifidobacterium simiarum]
MTETAEQSVTETVGSPAVDHADEPVTPSEGTGTPLDPSSQSPVGHLDLDDWVPDTVLDGYQQRTLHLGFDDEGELTATFVRKDPQTLTWRMRWRRWCNTHWRHCPAAILYVHGWNDYFYRKHASEFWEALGVAFYAVDLRKYGRSLHAGQTPGYITDLHEYFAELNALRDVIVDEMGDDVRILTLAHSTGGLIASLWMANERPDHVTALALNSPWLELQGNRFTRMMTTPVVKGFGLTGGKTVIPIPDPGFYGRVLWSDQGGEWTYQDSSPVPEDRQFLSRAGWMNAIFNGQEEVTRGLHIDVPVLVCTSDRSMILSRWDEAMREADTVLDVTAIRQNALNLGDFVTIETIVGGIHDLSMSKPEQRRHYFASVALWADRFAWSSPLDSTYVLNRAELKTALDRVARPRGGV